MSQKEMLKKRIDELCKELNTDAPYSSKSTEAQLNEMIDQLESQLPDDGDDNDRENSSKSLPNDAQLNQSGEGNGVSLSTEATVTQEIQNDNGKDDSSIMEKALASGDGFVLVQAQKTFICISDGIRRTITAGTATYLDLQAAKDAVNEGVAFIVANVE
ncbi:hypothetical protein NM449_17605 (plasmid) [Vibrio metschnikovii]|uniref:hypothetical protein n=1 Tax=Vibrio metschnikovii TaxID=28172 RepID=UPI00315D68EA